MSFEHEHWTSEMTQWVGVLAWRPEFIPGSLSWQEKSDSGELSPELSPHTGCHLHILAHTHVVAEILQHYA